MVYETMALSNPAFAVMHTMQNKWENAYLSLKIKGVEVKHGKISEAGRLFIDILTDRPGAIIGKGGKDIDDLKVRLEIIFQRKVLINLREK